MRKNGFLLFEVAIALLVVSSFFAILAWYISSAAVWQVHARSRIEAINCASSWFETGERLSSNYILTTNKKQLADSGKWEPGLSSQELNELLNNFRLISVTVQWSESSGNKRLVTLIGGRYNHEAT